jgi:hypothetical protein
MSDLEDRIAIAICESMGYNWKQELKLANDGNSLSDDIVKECRQFARAAMKALVEDAENHQPVEAKKN